MEAQFHPVSRRALLRRSLFGMLGLAGAALIGCDSEESGPAASSPTLAEQQALLATLSYNTASGGGVNLKHMPHPDTGELTVPLAEVFSFDRHHAFCRVDTNPEAFVMPTFAMGEVRIEPFSFYMAMDVTSVEQWQIETVDEATRRVVLRGGLDCATEVGRAESKLGDREASEHATYRIEAVDGGVGGGAAGDSFAFTVFFDPDEAPLNHAIFGPEFTFTGEMVSGEITIVDPRA
ncbi:MAG: hypothetical protein GEU80_12080 [Dehalococcoidia bacterium]|nr:hypothetical protein [Dehalococcoidia bacterium]